MLDISRLEPDQIPEYHAAYRAALADSPVPPLGLRRFTVAVTTGWAGNRVETWAALREGAVVGGITLVLPTADNTRLGFLSSAFVLPRARRQGIGTALVGLARKRCREEGREALVGGSRAEGPGPAFARAMGARPAMADSLRLLTLPVRDASALRAEAVRHSAGYALEQWTGPTPERLLPDLATLVNGMNDAPVGETGMEDMVWDAERVRRYEEAVVRGGQTAFTTVARHVATGAPAAYTRLLVEEDADGWADQEDTVVLRPHRGHRLGLLVKLANLGLLRRERPDVTRILTGNADSNTHMVAINEALGFQVLDRRMEWRLDLG
ncbi:GNAT family N-acetyltransferase [Thermoactinospora rubra]|uniref:GNAT family N-acetyltransferase n=1 Tax=Thermoactinospora rubra TaxID=1088767 RepID=UPI001301FE07|nr:GNAT family N-acetyltransferase [Thermoactinospora rubra]